MKQFKFPFEIKSILIKLLIDYSSLSALNNHHATFVLQQRLEPNMTDKLVSVDM